MKKYTTTIRVTMSCSCDSNRTSDDDKVTICLPRSEQPIIPYQCITRGALERIVASYNESFPDSKIDPSKHSANNLYLLVKDRMKEAFACDDEACWIEAVEKDMGAKQSLLSMLPPELPTNFKLDPGAWWSNHQINDVMRPYTYSAPFYWCGAVPLDFKQQRSLKVCLSKEACMVDIKSLVDQGCCVIGTIFNLDTSDKSGSHWVCCVVDLRRGDVCFFDSYGYAPPTLIKEWMVNCVNGLNKMALEGEWEPCTSKQLKLTSKDLRWNNSLSFDIMVPVSRELKVQKGQIVLSSVTQKRYIVKSVDKKRIVLNEKTTSKERDGDWMIYGARVSVSEKVLQKNSGECGSFCIYVILQMVQGNKWSEVLENIPSEMQIGGIRKLLHRNSV